MLKIRLMRIGTKQRPFYRVVAVDERNKRTGGYIENLGTYNPLTKPKEIKLNQERIDYWIKKGAQRSVGFLRIIGKAPQRKPRKPKKEAKQAPATPVATAVAEPVTAETPAETPEPPESLEVQPPKAPETSEVEPLKKEEAKPEPVEAKTEQVPVQETTEEKQAEVEPLNKEETKE